MNPDPAHYYEGGNFCSTFLAFAAAVAHDPGLRRTGLVTGLGQLGRLPMAFTYQDAVFNQPGKVSGSDFWWVVQFSKSCTCWKVIDRTSHPNV